MTRDDWAHFGKIEHLPEVQFAMRFRCEEQGHDWKNGIDHIATETMKVATLFIEFQICKWCNERK